MHSCDLLLIVGLGLWKQILLEQLFKTAVLRSEEKKKGVFFFFLTNEANVNTNAQLEDPNCSSWIIPATSASSSQKTIIMVKQLQLLLR